MISIHKALAGLDKPQYIECSTIRHFNPQGPRGPRQDFLKMSPNVPIFQSTRPSRASTLCLKRDDIKASISIHKALAGLDHRIGDLEKEREISIHKALAGLDPLHWFLLNCYFISIHKALAGLDGSPVLYFLFRYDFNPQGPRGPRLFACFSIREVKNFNPQGPRGPRPNPMWYKGGDNRFQSTRPSRASTESNVVQRRG